MSRSPARHAADHGREPELQPKSISRNDLMALSEESAKVTGIPYVMEAYSDAAEAILLS